MQMRRAAGFTLVELIMTLSVFSILVAIAVPSFRTAAMNARRTAAANEIITTLQRARGESLKSGRQVVVCPTTTPSSSGTCSATTTDWTIGWLSYVVGTGTTCSAGRPDTSTGCGDAPLGFYSNDYTGVSIDGTATVTLQPFNRASTQAQIQISDSRGASYGRTACTDSTGRPYIKGTATTCP